jgi:assimilatory nitrate reductase catalytic subunit
MYLRVRGDRVVGVEPRDHAINGMKLCPKGVTAYQQVHHPDRLTHPLVRDARGLPLRRATWDEALDRVASEILRIQGTNGRDAFGVYSGSSLTTEKCYLMGKFARVALGTRHVDYNGRLCMVSAAAANKKAFGVDRGTANPWSDMLSARVILVAGANIGECFLSRRSTSGGPATGVRSSSSSTPARRRSPGRRTSTRPFAPGPTPPSSTGSCT